MVGGGGGRWLRRIDVDGVWSFGDSKVWDSSVLLYFEV